MGPELHAELVAVVLSVGDDGADVLAPGDPARLPSGPLRDDHTSLQAGVRAFAADQTGHRLGYVEQLYTFADLGRGQHDHRTISISYLGLTREIRSADDWQSLTTLLPWEDQRDPSAVTLVDDMAAALRPWAERDDSSERRRRIAHLFGRDERPWRPELALQRYELLWEAGLVGESPEAPADTPWTGPRMMWDHRRILATGLSRLRAKLQYAPLVAELMPEEFTLGQLQDVVEALIGQRVHTQNFRRSIRQDRLVEATERVVRTGGRPAQLHRFRREVIEDRRQVGTKAPIPHAR
ncbi:NUDIX hydrolase [Brevibacterium jeotgali]|uniref:Uncharacterized conserved protein n=1 Tax=Brevibacterium jeotgali TaxID=1262550 RepID=A0A2H1L7Z5_9MICO|nr:hypothetical protein [Brevibacterium jeotgali]TWC03359.1 hypothetical protein FB108_2084 [Brevibacterium jeotgali]SMY13021.1 Uncharacterized conserved protein [Brevibacterium jeotgali]